MKKAYSIAIVSIIMFAVLQSTLIVFGQGPAFFNYQGRLLDGETLVNGNIELVLRLYNSEVAVTPLYEDSNTVTVVDGLYSTFIGDDTLSGSLVDALTNAEVWVEAEVSGVRLAPRERMASVCYALRAEGMTDGAITSEMLADDAVTE